MEEIKTQSKIIHYPQLDTVLLVENFIKENSGEYKKKSLWENLPKRMMYQTFQVVFNYLIDSKKIVKDSEGKIAWIWDPEGVEKLLQNPNLRRKNK